MHRCRRRRSAACNGCVQIPWALAATTVAYNVPGAPVHLRLNGATIANIFLGHITNWNDPAIAALNPGASLPNLKITPVFRSDGSGTSYNFSDYLSSVSPEWQSKIGVSTQPSFPAGVGAKGSGGVAGVVKNTPGGVTYVDVAYALVNHIRFAAVAERRREVPLSQHPADQSPRRRRSRRSGRTTRCTS